MALAGLTVWALVNQAEAEKNAVRAADIARVAVASERLDRDPTTAALVLLEVERPDETAYAAAKMHRVLKRPIALYELRSDGGEVYAPWSLSSGESSVLEGDGGNLSAASFSPNGNQVVTGSYDGKARVWNLLSPSEPLVLEGDGSRVSVASFGPNGDRLVTGSLDGRARVWNLTSPGEPLVLDCEHSSEPPTTARRKYEECERSHGREP